MSRRPRRRSGRQTVDNYQPPRIYTKQDDDQVETAEVEQIPVFYIDDREYTVPADLPPAVGLRYLRNVRYLGPDAAMYDLLVEALTEGEAAYNALADCDEIDREQMGQIMTMVMGVALGSVDPGKGSSSERSNSSGSSTT